MRKGTDTGRTGCASRRVAPSGNHFLPLLIGLVPPPIDTISRATHDWTDRGGGDVHIQSAWPRPRFLINFFDKYLPNRLDSVQSRFLEKYMDSALFSFFFLNFFLLLFSFVYTYVHTTRCPSGSHRCRLL